MLPPPRGPGGGVSRAGTSNACGGFGGRGDASGATGRRHRASTSGRARGRPLGRGGDARGDAAGRARSIKEPNGATGGTTDGAGASRGGGGGFGSLWDKATELTKKASASATSWAATTQDAVTKQVNEKAKLIQPSMNVAVDHFGPTARQINNLLKPITTPIRNEWMNLKPETRRVLKGGVFGAFFGNLILGWPARADRKRLRRKVEQMHLERTKMLVDDFSLEREVLALNAENRRLEKRTLRAEMALNAIKRRLGEYVVQPSKDDTHFADPNLQGVMPGAPWANDLLDAVGARMDGASSGGDANLTAVNALSNRGGDSKDGWSRRDEAWAHAFTLASEEASSDGGERPTK